ncbi:uncharacterized protein LOC126966680 [Leptidea sinapis]|uniref:uncharacterized protein LOC126966680 n=1 Tax=Leptidea sinapis TaxID=189913 RepID=UPI002141F1D7|nr:uncharacterized protein LOC126966680 [Leptidea sinapis]
MIVTTESWDPVIIFLVIQKLDQDSHKEWETYNYKQNTDDLPSWSDLKIFLESKLRTLELVTPTSENAFHVTPSVKSCLLCNQSHTLCHCKEFCRMSISERNKYVKINNLCYNCLSIGHPVKSCRLPISCRICNKRHHSLLHENKQEEAVAHTSVSQIQPQIPNNTHVEDGEFQVSTMMTSHSNTNTKHNFALLATAMVKLCSEEGHTVVLRTLIDQGSQASFLSELAAQLLKLKRRQVRGTITGVGSTQTQVSSIVHIQIFSTFDSNFCMPTEAYVMSKQITTRLPSKSLIKNNWPHILGLQLADPTYDKPGPIDLLLGVKEYANLIKQDIIRGPPGTPCAQKTKLGWILFGQIDDPFTETQPLIVMHHQIDLDVMIKKMWELENDTDRKLTQEEWLCEEIYKQTHRRNEDGRYVVNLPFKTSNEKSPDGNSKDIAYGRFLQLERRFERNPTYKEAYTKVIKEYLTLNHAEEVPENEKDNRAVYLSHHAVIRNDSESIPELKQ